MGNDVELLQSAFAAWRWCVHVHGLSGDETDSDGGGGSDDDQGSDDDGGDDESDDSPEPIDDVEQRVRPLFGPLNPAGALLSSGSFSEFNTPGGGQDRIMRARFFDTVTCEADIQCAQASDQWCRRRRRGLQLRDADHVETVLMIGQDLDLEFMRDLFIERILL
jgi:hypothetical protein